MATTNQVTFTVMEWGTSGQKITLEIVFINAIINQGEVHRLTKRKWLTQVATKIMETLFCFIPFLSSANFIYALPSLIFLFFITTLFFIFFLFFFFFCHPYSFAVSHFYVSIVNIVEVLKSRKKAKRTENFQKKISRKNCINLILFLPPWYWDSNSVYLGRLVYPSIAITPRSTRTRSDSTCFAVGYKLILTASQTF